MTVPNTRKKLLQRQIPTILGLLILVVALGAGLFFFSDGLGVFAPRATPQTTPKNIRVSNVSDTGFTVSFVTDETTAGFIKYGTESDSLRSQAGDDRDQLSGSVGSFSLHHITVRGLDPNTTYYYVLGTGSKSEFDNQGTPFEIKTAQRGGTPTAAKTIYGNVLNTSGGPAEGSIVYVSAEGMGDMSSLVKSSGSWAVPLSNARTPDGSGYAQVTDDTMLSILAQGLLATETSQVSTSVANSQPVETITLGQNGSSAPITQTLPSPSPSPKPTVDPASIPTLDTLSSTASNSAVGGLDTLSTPRNASNSTLASATTATPSATVVDLTETEKPVITTTQPLIVGQAAPNVVVSIEVNSETQIQQQITADENGEFELDISQLEKELEPGEHSVEYSYVDPTTGKTITKTKTFTVQPNAQLAQASTGRTATNNQIAAAQPFGSGNPVPIGGTSTNSAITVSPSPTASASPKASASATPASTMSGRTSQPSTASGIPTSGSVGMTFALLLGGGFFLITGLWSFWMSKQLRGEGISD